jgi:hypothetical protein
MSRVGIGYEREAFGERPPALPRPAKPARRNPLRSAALAFPQAPFRTDAGEYAPAWALMFAPRPARTRLGTDAGYAILAVALERAVALGIALYLPRHLDLADYGRYAFLVS